MMPDAAKCALFDLLKTLDSVHNGQHHASFARVAQGLGLELPAVATPAPDQAPDQDPGGEAANEAGGEADNEVGDVNPPARIGAAQDVHGRWIDECLDLSNPNATMFLADLFASWTAWTEREKEFTGTANAFSRELVRRWARSAKTAARRGSSSRG